METTLVHNSEFNVEGFIDSLLEAFTQAVSFVSKVISVVVDRCAHVQKLIRNCTLRKPEKRICPADLPWPVAEELARRNGLSKFQGLAGWLMASTRPPHRVKRPKEDYQRIAIELDSRGFKPVRCLEGRARAKLAENNRDARKAIHTFQEALCSTTHWRGISKTLYRAQDRFLKAYELSLENDK